MHTELLLKYGLGVLLAGAFFLLAKLIVERSAAWAHPVARRAKGATAAEVRDFFVYMGRLCQGVAVVWGLLDAVSVLLVA